MELLVLFALHGSEVTDQFVRANARAIMATGLASKGYVYINVDGGWYTMLNLLMHFVLPLLGTLFHPHPRLKGRYFNGTIYEDLTKFPHGMKGLGDWVRNQEIIGITGASEFLQYD